MRPCSALLFALVAASCLPPAPPAPPAPPGPPASPAVATATPSPPPPDPAVGRERRLARFVEASIRATHAYQVLVVRRTGKGEPACYSADGRDEAALEALVAHQRALFSTGDEALKAYAEAGGGDVEAHVEALVTGGPRPPIAAPVELLALYLQHVRGASAQSARAVAGMFQIALEDARPWDALQEAMRVYLALGLPVYLGQLGLPESDEDLLAMGRVLAPRACASPFSVEPAAWQLPGRQLSSWAQKRLHIRDGAVIAAEMMGEPAIQELIPRLRALPPRTLTIVGHSFTMAEHWSTPGTFVQIVAAVLARESPQITLRTHAAGGLGAAKAETMFLSALLAEKPDAALLVVGTRTENDRAALTRMGEALKRAHIEAYFFDDLLISDKPDRPEVAREVAAAAKKGGLRVIAVRDQLAAAPDRKSFLCLDGIHMKEPYHRLLAREYLRFLAGARGLAR